MFARTTWRPSRSRPPSSARASTRRSIDDVYFGCANQAGEDNRNVARMAVLLAGLPDSVAGVTVNRLCASGPVRGRLRLARRHRRGRGDRGRGRGRVDEPRAARHGEAGEGVPARQPDRLGHDARLALPEPAPRGAVSARVDGRDGRERRRALGRLARGSGRVRASLPGALGGGAPRRDASRTRSSRSATSRWTSTRARRRPRRRSPG